MTSVKLGSQFQEGTFVLKRGEIIVFKDKYLKVITKIENEETVDMFTFKEVLKFIKEQKELSEK